MQYLSNQRLSSPVIEKALASFNIEIFQQLFRSSMTKQKSVYMPMELILNKNKSYVSSSCLRFLKKSVLKLLDCTVY